MVATHIKLRALASADGGASTAFLWWLVHDVLISDEATLAGALIGGCFALWITSGSLWSRVVKTRTETMARGLWVLKTSFSIGMLLSLIVVGVSWLVQFVPNIPLVGGLSVNVPKPALAGALSLVGVVLVPVLWVPVLDMLKRFIETRWRS